MQIKCIGLGMLNTQSYSTNENAVMKYKQTYYPAYVFI